jgi:hypothetical protein
VDEKKIAATHSVEAVDSFYCYSCCRMQYLSLLHANRERERERERGREGGREGGRERGREGGRGGGERERERGERDRYTFINIYLCVCDV